MTAQRLSLGEMLKKNVDMTAKEKRDTENQRKMEIDKAHKEKYEKLQSFFDDAMQKIIDDIMDGKDKIEVSTYRSGFQYSELGHDPLDNNNISSPKSPFHTIWEGFNDWLNENGLECAAKHAHDGVGMESWTVYFITPKK